MIKFRADLISRMAKFDISHRFNFTDERICNSLCGFNFENYKFQHFENDENIFLHGCNFSNEKIRSEAYHDLDFKLT